MNRHGLLITTILITCIFMPLMIFLSVNHDTYAGSLRLAEGRRPDGDVPSEASPEEVTNTEIMGEMPDGVEASLCVPLAEDTDRNAVQVSGDPMSYRVYITIPTKEQNFYYKNELSGSQKGITGITYDYKDRTARFEIDTDAYYESSVYMSGDSMNLVLSTPKERYGYVYVLDPAYGGENTGSSGYGVIEKDVTLKAANAVMKAAETAGNGGFFTTRKDDEDISGEDRLKYNAVLEPDIFISFRVNSDSDTRMTNGISAEAGSPAMKEVADVMLDAISVETGQENKGSSIVSGAAGVEGNGIVIYLGYITNKAEAMKIDSEEYADKLGNVIYYLLSDSEEETVTD